MSVILEGALSIKKAKSDIRVYKILEVFHERLVAPYNSLYTYKPGTNVPDYPEKYCYYTGEGWLSAYTDKEYAETWKSLLERDFPEKKYLIYEMTVPKGTEYIERMDSKELRSKKLMFIK